ncbi:MAG: ABC-F family ATP-binding cassette domain-containing protein, partial [Lachnospiraceae bacterium]|nr:ABC-F family ATP-binding cassette domain-containing protein [Lachnospiraceae bacterium]
TVKAIEHRFAKEDENMREMPEEEEAVFLKFDEKGTNMPASKYVIKLEINELRTPDRSNVLSKNIELVVRGPEKICIIGANGAGKTTLIRNIAQELLKRKDINAIYMPQMYEEEANLEKSPVDLLAKTGKKDEITMIRQYLGSLKFTPDEMEHPLRELSGGQKAKFMLLKMVLSGANVLILDEPTRNFSPITGPVIRNMLKEFPGAIISVSHDRKYIAEVCDKVYLLDRTGLHSE